GAELAGALSPDGRRADPRRRGRAPPPRFCTDDSDVYAPGILKRVDARRRGAAFNRSSRTRQPPALAPLARRAGAKHLLLEVWSSLSCPWVVGRWSMSVRAVVADVCGRLDQVRRN